MTSEASGHCIETMNDEAGLGYGRLEELGK